ncbi:MAG: 8-amino-7-oxononanoate synthase [Synechococcales bacterium]|nr:8-amino-7-oxononanoate synthase [Synechococcales bacterium]
MTSAYGWIDRSLKTIHKAGWHRSEQAIAGLPGPVMQVQGRSLLNFSSNDYLSLAGDERLIQAAVQAVQTYGTGSTGSRLVTGHRDLHDQLEQAIADLKQTEDAIVFSSGYLANLGTIASLVSPRDVIFTDQYNHSSLRSGAKLSGAAIFEYRHCDMVDLQQQLSKMRSQYQRCLILTDTVFSMDGDVAPIAEILALADRYEAMVLVDEAHATGVLGASGAGAVEQAGCTGRPIVQMGTLSKALGSLGGYVAGSRSLVDFLRNRAPSWIYTTGLSPADTAAALAAVKIVRSEPQRREQLWQQVTWLKTQLQTAFPAIAPVKLLPTDSPILCLVMPDVTTALHTSQQLQAAGIFAPAIRPPTVPTSRIRLTLMTTHERSHLQHLVRTLHSLSDRY